MKGRVGSIGAIRRVMEWSFARILLFGIAPSLLGVCIGCGPSGPPSPAADRYIARAADDEEHAGLTQARDDIDDEMRAIVDERQEELARLRKENEELKAKVAAREKARAESGSKK